MAPDVPGEDAYLVEVEWQPILRFGEDRQVLCNLLVSILNLVEHEKRDNPLAFRILRDVERDIEIDHASEHPADSAVGVAHQPPIFDNRRGDRRSGLLAWLILVDGLVRRDLIAA